jgi:hypothetical protein
LFDVKALRQSTSFIRNLQKPSVGGLLEIHRDISALANRINVFEAVGDQLRHQQTHSARYVQTELGVFGGNIDRRNLGGRGVFEAFA